MDKTINRWLPPEPHASAVLEQIRNGQAHILERGHKEPPMLVWEDGGEMVLPTVRHIDGRFVSDPSSSATRQTHFHDVCSHVNELNALFERAEPLTTEERVLCVQYLEDMSYMLQRMKRRRQQYLEFADQVKALAEGMDQISKPDLPGALSHLDALREKLSDPSVSVQDHAQVLHAWAEAVRAVANDSEDTLREYRDGAIRLSRTVDQVRGGRDWRNPRRPPA